MEHHLANFVLERALAAGGMGEVWLARNEAGEQVAIKAIQVGAGGEDAAAALRRETHAAAVLSHPGIVRILAMGAVESPALPAPFVPGTPWFAMEHIEGRSLAHRFPTDWSSLRAILLQLLDALAHAHANGVLHRDLKPDNILLETVPTGFQAKLTDFGIAAALDPRRLLNDPALLDVVGTPAYMAPEQFVGDWRDYRPWTDLYQLGCTAFNLTSGSPPFDADNTVRMAQLHLSAPVPMLRPRFPIPVGFEGWLETLLAKSPMARFRTAANAAAALLELGSEQFGNSVSVAHTPKEYATFTLDETELMCLPTTVHMVPMDGVPAEASDLPASVWQTLPIPDDWRATRAALRAPEPSVFGVRRCPLIGRESERDTLWQVVRDVERTRSARLVVLTGPAGQGKARLARWVARRCHELCGADSVIMRASSVPRETDLLRESVELYTVAAHLPPVELRARIETLLAAPTVDSRCAPEAEAIVELLRPGATDLPPLSETEVYDTVARLLSSFSVHTFRVLVVEHAQWAPECVVFARRLLDLQDRFPGRVLVVLTADTDLGEPLAAASVGLKALEHRCRTIEVGPMQPEEVGTLVDAMWSLPPAVRQELVQLANGVPDVVMGLLADRLDGEVVLPTGPVTPADVWERRAAALAVDACGTSVPNALSIAASLGAVVENEEWRRACDFAGLSRGLDLAPLTARGFVTEREDGVWMFENERVRAALVALQNRSPSASSVHRAICSAIEGADGRAQRRRALHLWAAGDVSEALEAITDALHLTYLEAAQDEGQEAARHARQMAQAAGLAESDPRWGPILYNEVYLAGQTSPQEVRQRADSALRWAEANGQLDVWIRANIALGDLAIDLGELDLACEHYEAALAKSDRASPWVRSLTRRGFSDYHRRRGNLGTARSLSLEAMAIDRAHDNPRGVGWNLVDLVYLDLAAGDLETAGNRAEEVTELFGELRNRRGMSNAANARGDVHLAKGEYQLAEKAFREQRRLVAISNMTATVSVEYNLGLALLLQSRFSEARALLEPVHRIYVERAWVLDELLARLALAVCDAGEGSDEQFEQTFSDVRRLVAEHGIADIELATIAEFGAEFLKHPGLAARATEFAQEQRAALKR